MFGRFFSRNFPRPLVISRADARKNLAATHHIQARGKRSGNVKPRRQQVSGMNVPALPTGWRFRSCNDTRRPPSPSWRDRPPRSASSEKAAAPTLLQHLEALIIEFQLRRQVGAVHKQMKMILVHQCRMARITPRLRVEMEAKHEIRSQLVIDEAGTAADFAVSIKEHFALPADGVFLLRIGRAVEILPWIRHAARHRNCRAISSKSDGR